MILASTRHTRLREGSDHAKGKSCGIHGIEFSHLETFAITDQFLLPAAAAAFAHIFLPPAVFGTFLIGLPSFLTESTCIATLVGLFDLSTSLAFKAAFLARSRRLS